MRHALPDILKALQEVVAANQLLHWLNQDANELIVVRKCHLF